MAEKAPEWAPLSQMTFKNIGCKAKQAVITGKQVYLCRVFGEAADFKTKETRGGDTYHYLVGEFRAINADGEQYEAQKLFLPGTIMEGIEAALKTSEGRPVQFGYDIFANPDDKVTIGYRYSARTLLKTEASDRLNELSKFMDDKERPTEKKEKK